jgi:Caspase domain
VADGWNENHYAVVVAIQRYPGLRDLWHVRRDAESMITWFRSRAGGNIPRDNVVEVMADPHSEESFTVKTAQPTHDQVDDALGFVNRAMRQKLEADPKAWQSSRLYLYASGHGIAPGNGTAAVLMANVDGDPYTMNYGRNIELSLYRAYYEGCGTFQEVLLFADCCRDREFTAQGQGPGWMVCPAHFGSSNIAVGLASTYGEPAFEPTEDDDGHGYFTRALIDGLSGGATNLAGDVTTTSLGEYLGRAVPILTADKQRPQHPSMPVDAAKRIVIRPGPLPKPRRTVTIHFPAGYAGDVDLIFDQRPTGDRWRAALGPWTIELDEGLYQLRAVDGNPLPFAEDGKIEVIARDRDVRL